MKNLSNRIEKLTRKLKKKKYRKKKNKILLEGENVINEALKTGLNCYVLIIEERFKDKYRSYTTFFDIEVYTATNSELCNLSTTKTSYGIIGIFKMPEFDKVNKKNILFFDRIQDPGNLGTLIRSAVSFGVKNIVLSKKSVNPFSPKVIRSSAGYIFKSNITKKVIDFSKLKKDYFIYGTDLDREAAELKSVKKKEPFILILGNEGQGISNKYKEFIDKNIYIKTEDDVESLNVAVAGSIIMNYFY